MSFALPDELWSKILQMGVERSNLSYKDLCCVSISCKRLHRLSNEDNLWSTLLSLDFPGSQLQRSSISNQCRSFLSPSNDSIFKTMYKIRFEKDRARKLAAHRRAVLRMESRITENSRQLHHLRARKLEENNKLNSTVAELSNLLKVRQASVALNVWQPEVVRGRQKQIVEQCSVPVDARIHVLENEIKLCKQQITTFDKAYRDEKQRLETAKELLASMNYHPLQDYSLTTREVGDCSTKRKKLRRSSSADKEECGASGTDSKSLKL